MIGKKILLVVVPFLCFTTAYGAKKVVIDLSTQTATAYENGSAVFSGRVSTGQPKYPTPRGTFRIMQKKVKHRSSSWPKPNGGAKMDYMQRLTSYGIAMHLGFVPNYPASHGCIRLENGFAQRMYGWTYVGMPVKIVGTPPARVYRPKVAIKPFKINKKRVAVRNPSDLDVFSASPRVAERPVVKIKAKKKKKKVATRKLSALEVISASPKTKIVKKYENAKIKKKKSLEKIDPLAVISSSPKATKKSTVAKSTKSTYKKVTSLKRAKKSIYQTKEKTRRDSSPVAYHEPTTLDILSSSPKAAKKVEAAQKKKWENRPKRKAPKVDPLKAMRA